MTNHVIPASINRTFCVAPMMGYTHRHARYLFRLLSKYTMLYTEMVTAHALIRGNRKQLLNYSPQEHPLALQLGGNSPQDLSYCAKIAEDLGYDEINLNVGCPSNRVQSGAFGACLMAQPLLVQEIIGTIKLAVTIPVTVKCRIGIDDQDVYHDLNYFVQALTQVSIDGLVVHARKAWLHGINPKANRQLPPLNYERVYQLKREFPDLPIIMNGGIHSLDQAKCHLKQVDGVMLGRKIIQQPQLLSEVDQCIFGQQYTEIPIKDCLEKYLAYAASQLNQQTTGVAKLLQPVLGLFKAIPQAKYLRGLLCQPHKDAEQAIIALTRAIKSL